jgi:hypothetical protein
MFDALVAEPVGDELRMDSLPDEDRRSRVTQVVEAKTSLVREDGSDGRLEMTSVVVAMSQGCPVGSGEDQVHTGLAFALPRQELHQELG